MTTPPLNLLVDAGTSGVPIHAVALDKYDAWLAEQPARSKAWLASLTFKAEAGAYAAISGDNGALQSVVLGLGRGDDPWVTGALAKALPKGTYRIASVAGGPKDFSTWAAL